MRPGLPPTKCRGVSVRTLHYNAKNRRGSVRGSLKPCRSNGKKANGPAVNARFWSEVEAAQKELSNLEHEREGSLKQGPTYSYLRCCPSREVFEVAHRFSKRTERLFHSISELYQQALAQVKSGNETEARKLLTKATVVRAAHASQDRAALHSALATKLEEAIYTRQLRLLDKIVETGRSLKDKANPE